MATFDIQNFSVRLTGQNVSCPQVAFECRVVNTGTNNVVRDFTGANAVLFPNVLQQLTPAERLEVAEAIVEKLLEIRRRGIA